MIQVPWESWQNQDVVGMAEKAKDKASEIIATHYPQPLSDEQIREIETVRRWIEAGVPSDEGGDGAVRGAGAVHLERQSLPLE